MSLTCLGQVNLSRGCPKSLKIGAFQTALTVRYNSVTVDKDIQTCINSYYL